MLGRTNTGGGYGKLFAAVSVSYPVGSWLTCTDGRKTLKAKTTTGSWMFSIPYAGTWTVTATDGTKTSRKTVEITREYQSLSVNLVFEILFYNKGDECTNVTGGWLAYGLQYTADYSATAPTATKSATTVKVELGDTIGTGNWKSGVYITNNMIDLTDFNTLEFTGYGQWSDTYCGADVVVLPNLGTYWSGHPRIGVTSGTSNGTVKLDVSACKGKYYIGVALRASTGSVYSVMSTLKLY